jgi:hypothetical protein
MITSNSVIGVMLWRLVTTAVHTSPPDLVYDAYLLALQSHLELWLGILAANLPTIAPLLRRFTGLKWNSYFSKYRSGSGRSNKTPNSVGLRTFGGGTPRRQDHSDFGLLTDQTSDTGSIVGNSSGGIQKSQYFRVSIERPEHEGRTQWAQTTIV